MSEFRPTIRTSMQMSRASVDALRTAQLQKDFPACLSPEPTHFPKKILRIPHFHLLDTQSTAVFKPGLKTVSFQKTQKCWSQAQSPVSDPSHQPLRVYSPRQRRRSALTPGFSYRFREDWQTHPVEIESGSPNEQKDSIPIRGIVSPARRKPHIKPEIGFLTHNTAHLDYLTATAAVLTCTKDLVRRHTSQKVPARLLKF